MDLGRIGFVLDVLISCCAFGIEWKAITDYDEWYVNDMYKIERNGDPPSASDPATAVTGAYTRYKICQQIVRSGAFKRYGREAFTLTSNFEELQRPMYSDVFDRIYTPANSGSPSLRFEYTNEYAKTPFDGRTFPNNENPSIPNRWDEYVFVCLLQKDDRSFLGFADDNADDDDDDDDENPITPIYVSKIYDSHDGADVHRFIFMRRSGYYRTMLVEQPAFVYTASDFNVELQYIRLKKDHERAFDCQDDPLCTLNIGMVYQIRTFRLCSIALTASYFKARIAYPRRLSYQRNYAESIAFQTEVGQKAANADGYSEWTLQCWANMTDGDVSVLHVSRAYKTNEAFVYVRNRDDHKLYVEAWIKNLHLVREPVV